MKFDRSQGRPEPIRALNRIKELENGEPHVELAKVSPNVLIHRESVIPYLRESVAIKLEAAAKSLAPGYKIGVIDAWRPFARQVRIYEWMWKCLEEARPNLPYATKRRMICRFVAPTDQKAPPGHTTGAAVDVFLLDSDGQDVDVMSPLTRLQGAPTFVYGLTPEAKANRMRLYEAMMSQGFSNCRDEWWHYSYGDAGWAVRMDRDECFYGKIELPKELYRRQEKEWLENVKERANPFLY